MYNITRAKAAQVVQQTLTALTGETWNVTLPGAHLDERKIFPMSAGRLSDRCWKIESDASIQARNTYERTELVSPVLTWEQMPLLQQIIRDLRKAGAKSDPAHQCGVHVHVDGAGHSAQTLLNLTNIMAKSSCSLVPSVSPTNGCTGARPLMQISCVRSMRSIPNPSRRSTIFGMPRKDGVAWGTTTRRATIC